MIFSTFIVALGGAIGAALRYLTMIAIQRIVGPTEFPLAVLTVNVVGSTLMGVFIFVAAHRGLSELGPFVMVGVLGGFTTFSAFSFEAVSLIQRGDYGAAGLYMALSVGLSVAGLMAGLWLARGVLI